MSWVVTAVMPMPSMMARWFQGSPTQKPSMLPTRMLATICGGGTVMTLASFSGLMPGGQPVVQPHGVGAGGEGLGEGVFALVLPSAWPAARVHRALVGQLLGQ
jgi:hypothetical protein